MLEVFTTYWPHILAVISTVMGTVAAVHAAMTKRDVRSAVGWVGVIILSPILGALIYFLVGINRIRRASIMARRALRKGPLRDVLSQYAVEPGDVGRRFGGRMESMRALGDRVVKQTLTSGNVVVPLVTGDEAYDAMCRDIEAAERSIILETYIFDRDAVGLRVADCLIAAQARGVEVRVLIDAVGARYSVPSILGYLQDGGVAVKAFNGKVIMGLRLPYANLRTHRKIIVVDGRTAFIGGMNIRAAFAGTDAARDTHFRLTGPAVSDLFSVAADDWHFETGEVLKGEAWHISVDEAVPGEPPFVRTVVSGPDTNLETNHKMLLGAFSVAERSIRIMSPYFLPDNVFLSALSTAARRGVAVDIVVPETNNLAIVNHAMNVQFEQIVKDGCRIWRAPGTFDHSKLLAVDGQWAFVGSSNLDSRSMRLNFEVDIEVYDTAFAAFVDKRITSGIENGEPVTLERLQARPFVLRLFERVLWLASPYL